MSLLRFERADLAPARAGPVAVRGLSLSLRSGEFAVLLGANGAGKTTILRAALGLIAPRAGSVLLDGAPVHRLKRAQASRLIAYLPQIRSLALPLRVRELVALGRFAAPAGAAAAVERALARTGLAGLAERRMNTLSGGEQARAHLARAFAAEAPILLVDEPNAAIDPGYAWAISALLREEAERGALVLAAMHDWRLARRFAHRVVFLAEGRLKSESAGGPGFAHQHLAAIYGPEGEWAEALD